VPAVPLFAPKSSSRDRMDHRMMLVNKSN